MKTVGKPKLMRKINRGLIVQAFRERQELTNTELKRITGLSRRTINLIIESLKNTGVVKISGYGDSTSEGGKKPAIYKFIPDSFYAIGVMIRDLKAYVGISNLNGEIRFKDEILIEWDLGRAHVATQITDLIKNIINRSRIDLSRFLGIGVGLPGIIDSKNGIVKTLTRHEAWENYGLDRVLEKKLELRVEIKSENHIRVLGEKWFGLAKDYKDFVTVITTNDGIGAGVVLNNKLMSSKNCLLGEIGHIKIIDNGKDFRKFRDFEYYLGIKHVNEIIRNNVKLKSYSVSSISGLVDSGKEVSFDDLFYSYNSGDEFSKIIVDKITNYFASLIEIIVCTYDPELIIIQGKYSLLEDDYFKKIADIVKESVYPQVNKEIVIKRTTRAQEMSIIGAAGIIFDEISL